jgi:hypothetical protein
MQETQAYKVSSNVDQNNSSSISSGNLKQGKVMYIKIIQNIIISIYNNI